MNNSDFESADFEGADLTGAYFGRSCLANVNFKNAKVKEANFFKAFGLTNDQKKYSRENGGLGKTFTLYQKN